MTKRLEKLHNWLIKELELEEYSLKPASEDASFRHYYRLEYNGSSWIVMDAPPLQEDCRPFIDIAGRLRAGGVNAPEIYKADLGLGFLLLTDFGDTLYSDALNETNAEKLYSDALIALHKMQQAVKQTNLPPYDTQLLQQEMELFREWFLLQHLGINLSAAQHSKLDEIFLLLIETALEQAKVFVHRDYHSRNLMYCEQNNPGILDFQDAVVGPCTYDLVSLLKDCYIKWPRQQINQWARDFYRQNCPGICDENSFMRWFDLMGVQRHLKASGIFARLNHRDSKPGYLKDIPRTLSYITDLEQDYPELDFLIELIRTRVLPVLET